MKSNDWVEASTKKPCVNCGKTSWCRHHISGTKYICQRQRILNGIEKKDKNGEIFWLYTNNGKSSVVATATATAATIKKNSPSIAEAFDIHLVYTYLLSLLSLDTLHFENLNKRGLSFETITNNSYKSLPSKGRRAIYQNLEKEFGESLLKKVPGFIVKDGRLTLGGASGILIPVRDTWGMIVAVLIRPDKIIDGNKYLWLSSSKYGGPSSGRHIHVPLHSDPVDVVHITEGALKADVAAELGKTLTIGIPGTGGFDSLPHILKSLKAKEVIISLDADSTKNIKVAKAILDIFNLISSLEIKVGYQFWDLSLAKGLDDALLAKIETKILYGDDAKNMILELPPFKKLSESAGIVEQSKKRPALHHGICQMFELINSTWKVILESNTPEIIFRNASSIVMLADNERHMQIVQVDQVRMFGHLVRISDWFEDFRRSANNVPILVSEPSTPPKDLIKDLLVFVEEKLPRLACVLEAPTFGKNGQLVFEPGYNRLNGIYLDSKRLLKISPVEHESIELLKQRILFFKNEVFSDFPFATESDFTHLIAILITGVMREMVDGPTPLFIINATSPGSGKSLLAELISLILTGTSSEARSIPKSEDEIRKSITSELIRGPRLILFDNADQEAGKIHSPTLAAVLTSTIWTDRILSQSKMTSVENRALWMLTGNNVSLTSELHRRSVQIKLEPSTSKPWERQSKDFKHANIKSWVKNNRSDIMHALISLCYSWVQSGSKPSNKTLGSFESWSSIVGGVIEHIGLNNFLDNQNENYNEVDAELTDWQDFTKAWWSKFKNTPQRVSALYQICEGYELLSSTLGPGSDKSRQTKLGIELKNKVGRIFGNHRLQLSKDAGGHGKFYNLELLLTEVTHEGSQDELIDFKEDFKIQGDLRDLSNVAKGI